MRLLHVLAPLAALLLAGCGVPRDDPRIPGDQTHVPPLPDGLRMHLLGYVMTHGGDASARLVANLTAAPAGCVAYDDSKSTTSTSCALSPASSQPRAAEGVTSWYVDGRWSGGPRNASVVVYDAEGRVLAWW